MKKIVYGIVALLMLGSIFQHLIYWPNLPEKVATHFGPNGEPDQWMSRTASVAMMLGFQLAMPVFMLGLAWTIKFMPDSMVNIPNREYWLHPDRREFTYNYTQLLLGWIAVLTTLFLMVLAHLTFLANRTGSSLNLPAFLTVLIAYLVGIFGLVGYNSWRFRLPSETPGN